ncbi:MAG: hypothetical protein JJT99_08670 [Rhodobacteraceae bacterium]|nr:hypothetical protein [Paracoccaceae bacterium]
MSELVEIATVFKVIFEKRPLPQLPQYDDQPPLDWMAECAKRENHVLAVICDELQATGKAAVLISGGQRVDLPASDLRQAPAHHLARYSILMTAPWALREYAKYERAVVFIPQTVKDRAIRTATEELGAAAGRGRPGKIEATQAAYYARFPDGHEAAGIPLKAVPSALGMKVSARTISRAINGIKRQK